MENQEPLVSVVMLTYNHEKYIVQALESILMQQVDFIYEIVIGEDCSPDNTRAILLEYKEKYPDKIKLIARDKNIGAVKNFVDIYRQTKGKYIANLEGDDYWSNPGKLQMQIDFLENNSEFSACYHRMTIIDQYEKVTGSFPVIAEDINNAMDFFARNHDIGTASVIYRKFEIDSYKTELILKSTMIGDFIINAINADRGKIKFLNKDMATYRRITSGGSSFSARKPECNMLEFIALHKNMGTYFLPKYQDIITKKIEVLEFELLNYYLLEGRIIKIITIFLYEYSLHEKQRYILYMLDKINARIRRLISRLT